MLASNFAFKKPLVKESFPRQTCYDVKVVALTSFFVGLGFLVVLALFPCDIGGSRHQLSNESFAITMLSALPLRGQVPRRRVIANGPGQARTIVPGRHGASKTIQWNRAASTQNSKESVSDSSWASDPKMIEFFNWRQHLRNSIIDGSEMGASLQRLPAASRIVAVGDLHGDFTACRSVLDLAGVARNGIWTGGKTVLVQLGDVLDRGHEEAEILAELKSLKKQAHEAGGAVVTVLGNHEVLNLVGDMRYVAPEALNAFGPDRVAAFAPGGDLAREFVSWPVIAIVGDTAFVHGGLPGSATPGILGQLNADARSWLRGYREEPPWLHARSSPLWLRDQSAPPGREPSNECCKALKDVLAQIGAKRLVVGHTPQKAVNCACNGLVWRCDTGMAQAMGSGAVEALEIVGTHVRVISSFFPREHGLQSQPKVSHEQPREFQFRYPTGVGVDLASTNSSSDSL